MTKKSPICNHYPMLGMDANVKYGGCWKIIEQDMHHVVRQCVKCGEINVGNLTSYSPELFISEKRRVELKKDRADNAKNMIQPIDPKTGKFNEDFGRAYGYNPLKTPAPQVNSEPDEVSGDTRVAEENINLNKL